jgi:tripartite-type tricarboxylate transporter receptor subunit TctC
VHAVGGLALSEKLNRHAVLRDALGTFRFPVFRERAQVKRPCRRQFLHLAAGAAALPVASRVARAQTYPARPVRIIVGFAPGSVPDIYARLIGQWLSERLGQPFIIENRAGAGGNLGTEAVVRAAPDGYTLLQVTSANSWNTTLYDKLNFNFIDDIAPVASIYSSSAALLVNGWNCVARRLRPPNRTMA